MHMTSTLPWCADYVKSTHLCWQQSLSRRLSRKCRDLCPNWILQRHSIRTRKSSSARRGMKIWSPMMQFPKFEMKNASYALLVLYIRFPCYAPLAERLWACSSLSFAVFLLSRVWLANLVGNLGLLLLLHSQKVAERSLFMSLTVQYTGCQFWVILQALSTQVSIWERIWEEIFYASLLIQSQI